MNTDMDVNAAPRDPKRSRDELGSLDEDEERKDAKRLRHLEQATDILADLWGGVHGAMTHR